MTGRNTRSTSRMLNARRITLSANTFPIAFADFKRAYIIVDRRGTTVLRDPYTAKPYVIFHITRRVGGGIQNFEALKLLKCEA